MKSQRRLFPLRPEEIWGIIKKKHIRNQQTQYSLFQEDANAFLIAEGTSREKEK